ncbi:hypothetical protein [Chitinophaga flava]|nr:hypothetical protein [Chitinophaga flava]
MKKILFFLLLMPAFCFAQQTDKLLYGYAYVMNHDGNIGGGVVCNVELWNIVNIGPGVEVTSFEDHGMIPVFIDMKIKYRFDRVHISPYITGQFGYNSYNVKQIENLTTPSGIQAVTTFNKSGKYFYGAGLGVIYHFKKIGVYASYIYRGYEYTFPKDIKINDEFINIPDQSVSANLFVVGITF